MTVQPYSTNDFYHKIYFETCDEFEKVRESCLSEGNWLGRNFEKDRLKIEDHKGFGVVFHKTTHEPVTMGGVFNDGRYPEKVARHLHRYYSFPKWRGLTRQQIIDGWKLTDKHLIQPLNEINNFELYFMSMQTRDKKNTKGYFHVWSETLRRANSNWKSHEELIQTCPFDVQQCWQNFVYMEIKEGAMLQWSPNTLNHNDWANLPLGID